MTDPGQGGNWSEQPRQPDYGHPAQPPTYGQPAYGQPPQDPAYGQPAYGYGQPPTGPVGPEGQPPSNGGKRRRTPLIAVAIAAAIVIAVVAYFVVGKSNSSNSGSTPTAAVKALLAAGETGDRGKLATALCPQDRVFVTSVGDVPGLTSAKVTSYTIGTVTQKDATHATVQASVKTTNGADDNSADVPVLKSGGKWQVCFTSGLSSLPSGLPTHSSPSAGSQPSPTSLSSDTAVPRDPSLPTDISTDGGLIAGLCAQSSDAEEAANTYMGAIDIGMPQFAQGCVYHESVPESTTQGLAGTSGSTTIYIPDPSRSSGNTFIFNGSGKTVTVTVTKESDGKNYVTDVKVS